MSTESKKHKNTYIFVIKERNQEVYLKQFNTDRSVDWTIKQYSRNREIIYMNLI